MTANTIFPSKLVIGFKRPVNRCGSTQDDQTLSYNNTPWTTLLSCKTVPESHLQTQSKHRRGTFESQMGNTESGVMNADGEH